MSVIILDTDFLSAFLKIKQCNLIRTFYQVEQLFIPAEVHRELAQTDLLADLLTLDWIKTLPPPATTVGVEPLSGAAFQALGAGEQAGILLVRALPDALLLTNDNKARLLAQAHGITAVNIPAFLLACKMAGLLDVVQMSDLIHALETKDHYSFKAEIRAMLLQSE